MMTIKVHFPIDWEAVLWFLSKLVCAADFQRPRRTFSPFGVKIASLAIGFG